MIKSPTHNSENLKSVFSTAKPHLRGENGLEVKFWSSHVAWKPFLKVELLKTTSTLDWSEIIMRWDYDNFQRSFLPTSTPSESMIAVGTHTRAIRARAAGWSTHLRWRDAREGFYPNRRGILNLRDVLSSGFEPGPGRRWHRCWCGRRPPWSRCRRWRCGSPPRGHRHCWQSPALRILNNNWLFHKPNTFR